MSFFRNIISGGAAIDPNKIREMEGKLAAIEKSQASIEFKPDGTIVTANQNFLNAMGYRLEEIQGQHHSIFVSPKYSKFSCSELRCMVSTKSPADRLDLVLSVIE